MAAHTWVRGSVVTAILTDYGRHGGDVPALLAQRGLSRVQLDDPYATVPMATYVAMFEAMAEGLDDPLLGARLGLATRPVDLGPAGMLMARSRSIMVALDRLTRFVSSFQPGTHAALTECDGLLVWTYRLADPAIWPRRQDAEFTLSSLIRLIRSAFLRDWRPLQVHLEHAPASPDAARALERLLGCPIRFEAASNGLILPLEETRVPIRDEDQDLIALLERYLVDLTPRSVGDESWSSKVAALIATYLGHQPVTLDRVAADLATAPRSLQRRLAEEGTSLRRLLAQHRQNVASQLLQAGAPRLASLAEALGYADGSTFWRAHRQWTGKSPSAIKAERRRTPGA